MSASLSPACQPCALPCRTIICESRTRSTLKPRQNMPLHIWPRSRMSLKPVSANTQIHRHTMSVLSLLFPSRRTGQVDRKRPGAIYRSPVARCEYAGIPALHVRPIGDAGGRGLPPGRSRFLLPRPSHPRRHPRSVQHVPVRHSDPCTGGKLDHLALGIRHDDGLDRQRA